MLGNRAIELGSKFYLLTLIGKISILRFTDIDSYGNEN